MESVFEFRNKLLTESIKLIDGMVAQIKKLNFENECLFDCYHPEDKMINE